MKNGDIVNVSHYSIRNPFKSLIVNFDEKVLVLKLTRDFAIYNCMEGDPVVVSFSESKEMQLCECTISEVNPRSNSIVLTINGYKVMPDLRTSERYPVSIYSDIRYEKSRVSAVINNLSIEGMSFRTKADLSESSIVGMDVILNNHMLSLTIQIVRKTPFEFGFEYGSRIIYDNNSSKNTIRLFLQTYQAEQEKYIRQL